MSSTMNQARRCAALVVAKLGLVACGQTSPATGPERAAARAPGTGSEYQQGTIKANLAGVDPGIHPEVVWGVRHNPFANDPASAQEGR